jgi:hypothetical protein
MLGVGFLVRVTVDCTRKQQPCQVLLSAAATYRVGNAAQRTSHTSHHSVCKPFVVLSSNEHNNVFKTNTERHIVHTHALFVKRVKTRG